MLQHFFIEGKYLGQVERGFDLTQGRLPDSILLYCECCGETFARFPVTGRPFIAYRRLCRKCPSSYASILPGSIWLSWEHETMQHLPLPVLKWEFDRELEHLERLQNGES